MSEWYGNKVVVMDIDHEIVKGNISRIIDSLKLIEPEWETMELTIKKQKVSTLHMWEIGVRIKGKLKDEKRYQESDMPDYPEE